MNRAQVHDVPIAIRSTIELDDRLEQRLRVQLARRLGGAAFLERATVRFEDINGPRGGVDIACRIKVVVRNRPSVIVEKRGVSAADAFAKANHAIGTALARTQRKHGLHAGARPRSAPAHRPAEPFDDPGELIGRRVGRGSHALARALERPEKLDRAAYVDTAARGVSATDRKAGGFSTARRNARARDPRATATLEDSRRRPSRKSTRKSANRAKPSQMKERTAAAATWQPSARASRR